MVRLSVPTGVVAAGAALSLDGEPQPRLNAGLQSLSVSETIEGLYRCEARLGNWGSPDGVPNYLYFDRDQIDFGQELTVTLGSGEGRGQVFRGKISALEGQFLPEQTPQIVVLAEDSAQAMRQTRRSRTFEDVSDADVFEQIASDHGLQTDIDIPTITYPVIAQLNQSDLAFVRERARRLAAEVWIDDGTLHVKGRSARADNDDMILQFNSGLLAFTVIADTANQPTQVVVSGWDVQAKDGLTSAADDSLLTQELNGDDSGASIVQQAFGERRDRIVRQVPLTLDEAQALAEASFRAQARQFVVGTGVARGDARIRVGRQLTLRGLGPLFSGQYYLSEVTHLFHRGPGGGYTTEFVAERPGVGSG
jgi:phage protein D